MGFAEAVDCPVILVADIDRGRVFTADHVSNKPVTIQLRQTSVRDALRMILEWSVVEQQRPVLHSRVPVDDESAVVSVDMRPMLAGAW